MKIAYLILTHNMPDHLGRLIAALSDEHAGFFVHVDQKYAIEPFLVHQAPNVFFLGERVPVYWGQWQTVEATLNLIRSALEHDREYDYMVLLSGSCYPIRSRKYIQQVFAKYHGDEFINAVQMPNAKAGKPLSRLDRFYMRSDQSRFEFLRRVASGFLSRPKSGRLFSKKWLLARDWRRGLGSLVPYGGSEWWALTGEACRYIDEFVRREQTVVRFFENSRVPDEMFFQTILANSGFAPRMRRSLMYTDWVVGGSHPAEITEQHIHMFAQHEPLMGNGVFGKGELCFARKFPDDGGRMVKLVDYLVRRREKAVRWEVSHSMVTASDR
jgi:hypothetical protein